MLPPVVVLSDPWPQPQDKQPMHILTRGLYLPHVFHNMCLVRHGASSFLVPPYCPAGAHQASSCTSTERLQTSAVERNAFVSGDLMITHLSFASKSVTRFLEVQ